MPEKLPTIPEAEIEPRLRAELPGWTCRDGWIRRSYATDGWSTTVALVNAISYVSEAAWHHPDLEVTWGTLRVRLRTHDADGITERDFALAREIERLVLWRPDRNGPLGGAPRRSVRAVAE